MCVDVCAGGARVAWGSWACVQLAQRARRRWQPDVQRLWGTLSPSLLTPTPPTLFLGLRQSRARLTVSPNGTQGSYVLAARRGSPPRQAWRRGVGPGACSEASGRHPPEGRVGRPAAGSHRASHAPAGRRCRGRGEQHRAQPPRHLRQVRPRPALGCCPRRTAAALRLRLGLQPLLLLLALLWGPGSRSLGLRAGRDGPSTVGTRPARNAPLRAFPWPAAAPRAPAPMHQRPRRHPLQEAGAAGGGAGGAGGGAQLVERRR